MDPILASRRASRGGSGQKTTGAVEAEQAEIIVEVAEDGLQATVRAVPELFGDRRILKQFPFIRDLFQEDVLEETFPALELRQVTEALEKHGVNVGLDMGAVAAFTAEPTAEPQVVARGLAPVCGKDAFIEFKFEQEAQLQLPTDEAKKVDWRDLVEIPTVKAGAELAIKHPAEPGKAGLSVTGETITPAEPKDVQLRIGEGCEIVKGEKVVATRNGRPALVNGRIVVFPVFVQERGVDLSSGNIRFDGDVVVKGDIDDNMTVEAGGDVCIVGNANNASLRACGEIEVRGNVIGGSVQAGGFALLHQDHSADWEELTGQLDECVEVMGQMRQYPRLVEAINKEGWLTILRKLVDCKFARLKELAVRLDLAYQEADEDTAAEAAAVLGPLKEILQWDCQVEDANLDRLIMINHLAKSFHETMTEKEIQDKQKEKSNLSFKAYYVQGANIEASGDIIIFGPGCYQSRLKAGRGLYVEGRPGLIRGKGAYAKKEIVVNEVGSAAGTPTFLRVDAGGTIKIRKVHPNVTIRVGNQQHKFDCEDGYVVARLDNEDKLKLHSVW